MKDDENQNITVVFDVSLLPAFAYYSNGTLKFNPESGITETKMYTI